MEHQLGSGFGVLSLPALVLGGALSPFADIHDCHPVARLYVYGTGPLEGSLKAKAPDLGLGDAVVVLGCVDHK